MNCQNYKFVTDGNDVINELREKINYLRYELEYLKGREILAINSLFQDDLNKIKTGLKVCSNALQSTNDLFRTSDKKNTEISVELKSLKREINKRFDEEKDLCKSRNELFNLLKEGMVKLQNIAKQLGNEAKNLRDGLKEEHERVPAAYSVTQSTEDLKNSEKRITETSNELKALKTEISKCLSGRTEVLGLKGSFVKEEDLLKVRNGVLNVYSRGIQQVHEINKEMSNEIKNLDEGLKKQQEKIDNIVESTNTIIKTRKNLKIRLSMTENSIKQFSGEIKNLQSELKAEQQKNRFLENKLMTFESHLKEILLRNDIKHNPNKEISIDGVPAPNTTKQSAFVPEICKLEISDPQTKEQDEMDLQSKLLIHDFERTEIVSKVHDDANFNEEVKSKFACEEVKVKDISEEECRFSFPENAETFYEKESSHLSIHSQIDELTKNQCTDFAFESSSGKEGALSYLEKAHAYLQNLQLSGIFPLSDEESSTVPEDGSSVAGDLENDAKKNCGKEKKKKKKRQKTKRRNALLRDKIEWLIRGNGRPNKGSTSERSYQSSVFYTGEPGYRLQLHAKINRQEEEIFFCLQVLEGVYDNELQWPCQQGICMRLSEKMQSNGIEYRFIPEKDVLKKPNSKNGKVHTKWLGPFNLSHYLGCQDLIFDIYLG